MNMMIPLSEFQQRRQQLLQQLEATGTKAVAVVAAAQLQTRSRDTEYPFRQDSDFYYLTGFNEPNALLVLAPHAEHPEIGRDTSELQSRPHLVCRLLLEKK